MVKVWSRKKTIKSLPAMKTWLLALIFFGLTTNFNKANADEEPLRVVAPYIYMMAESPTDGVFIKVYQEIAKRTGQEIIVDVLPPRRAVKAFEANEYHAFGTFPALTELPNALPSVPYFVRENLIFFKTTNQSTGRITELDSLTGLRVGLSAYHYPASISDRTDILYERVPNDLALFRMLERGRFDAVIVERYAGSRLIDILSLKDVIGISETPVTSENILFLFQPTPTGIENQNAFNLAIYDMFCDGTLSDIFGRDDVLPQLSHIEPDIPDKHKRDVCTFSDTALQLER